MPNAIHQFLAGYSQGDAISNEARVMRDIFSSWGYTSKIYCESKRILPELRKECFDAVDYQKNCDPDDVVILHLSIGSVVNEVFARLNCRKVVLYHNITPSFFFQFLNKEIAHQLAWGREQMKSLAGSSAVNLADSRYNADELEEEGYGKVSVLPLVMDLAKLDDKPDRPVLEGYHDGKTNILFVGRCAPNKAIHDLLYAFHYFQRYVEPNARLILVGSSGGVEQYGVLLKTMVTDLDLHDVRFIGAVSQRELNAYYRIAHLFLCMSEHEGFGIPLIETMYLNVPLLAYDCTAVADTMDGAGVLAQKKDFAAIAEMMGQITRNPSFREAILAEQQQRVERYTHRNLAEELKKHLAPVLN